jgi:hypothetical protein
VALLCGVVGAALAVGGCGASQVIDPVSQAAAVTASAPGYRMSAVMTLSSTSAPVTASMKGSVDTASNSGTMSLSENVSGQAVKAAMIFSRLNFWMKAAAIPGASQLTGGKAWIYVDMSKALGAMGVGSLPGTTDPSQFLDYLRTVGASPTVVRSVSINGTPTTEYRAEINLDRYASLYHASAQTVSAIETAIGSHTMPVQAWVDGQHRVRRLHVSFPECVAGSKVRFSMTMGIYDFGAQPQAQIPQRKQVYNLTPALVARYGNQKLGCA